MEDFDNIFFDGIPENIKNLLHSEDTIFHYTKMDTAIEKILPNMELKFSKDENFADPFEQTFYAPGFSGFVGDEKVADDKTNLVINGIKSEKDLYHILSFSANETYIEGFPIKIPNNYKYNHDLMKYLMPVPGFRKDRMWEIYGNKFKGVCLVISKEKLLSKIGDYSNIVEHEYDFVNYKRSYRNLNPNLEYGENIDVTEVIKKYFKHKYFNKVLDYRDESEYRILVKTKDNKDLYVDITDSLQLIILGHKMDENYYTLFSKYANDIPIIKFRISTSHINIALENL